MGGLVLWGRVQRTKEFDGRSGGKVRLILRSVVLSAVLPLTLLMLLLHSVAPPAQAQGGYSPWQTFTTVDGLADNNVNYILQAGDGTLWFATRDGGVSVYDGASWQTFTTADGLAANEVEAILEDSRGMLWFQTVVTDGGVSCYDGQNWHTFTAADGLAPYPVSKILEDREGTLWFGTSGGGVSHYDGQNWQTFTTVDGLAADGITAILQDSRGVLWFGTSGGGVSHYDGRNWQTFTAVDGLAAGEITAILEDSRGAFWFGSLGGGVSQYDGQNWQTFTTADGLATNDVVAILEDREGRLWFGTRDGISQYDGQGWHTFVVAQVAGGDYAQHILEDREGALWFGTSGGVSRYDGHSWQSFTTADGLTNNSIWAMLEDEEGALWFGTHGGGVSRYDGRTWRRFYVADGLIDDAVLSILEDGEGTLWFGTSGGVSRYDGQSWRSFTNADGLTNNSVWSILEDRGGALWFGTVGGVSRYDGESWQSFTTVDGLASHSVWSILEDKGGVLWFGTYEGGVSRYDGETWQTFTTANGLVNDADVLSLLEDRKGVLWFGTGGGVSRYDGRNWQSFTAADGLGAKRVWAMLEDREGTFWFGTQDGGVTRYDGQSWQSFAKADGLAANWVLSILEDGKGTLWFGTYGGGVSRYDRQSWLTFTTADGLSNNNVNSIVEDQEGALWFGTDGGVSRYLPGKIPPWTRVIAINDYLYSDEMVSLSYSENSVTITFAGGDLRTLPENLLYLYKMEGVDEKWQVTTEKSVSYPNLNPGTYTFHVKARDEDFNYTDPPATAQIVLEQPLPTPTPMIVSLEPTVNLPFLGSIALTTLYASVGLLVVVGLIAAFSVSRFRAYQRTRRAIKRQENPYITNVPVSDPKMFFGRQEILNQIVNGIHLNNFAVCGPKRIGKTSLLHRLAAELCQMDDAPCSFFPVLLSLHGVPESRLFRALMLDIAREYRSQIAPLALRCRAAGEYNAYDFLDDLDAVQETLQQAIGDKSLRLVLLVDEGDALNGYSQAILAQLRFVFMGPALNYLKMVWSGEDLDRRKWKLRGSDWLTVFGHVFHLIPFTEEEAIRLIVEPVPYYRYDKQAVRLILDHSQLIPHRIQLLCWGAVEEMLKARRGRITVEDVEASIRHLTGETAPPGVQPSATFALAADSKEQPVRRLAEGDAEYHANSENEEAR
jgi:ligand-binding sensor domain-containing protein